MRDSLVICTLGRPRDLERCLASIACQVEQPAEILIVDASDNDQTETLVRQMTHDRWTTLRHVYSPRGLTLQRNYGMRKTSGDIVHFLDDDVEVCSDYFQRITDVFMGDAGQYVVGVGGIISHPIEVRKRQLYTLLQLEARRPGAISLSGVNTFFTGNPTTPYRVDWLMGCSMSYRRAAVIDMLFDETLDGVVGDDVDFSTRASVRGSLMIAPGAHVEHHESPINRDSWMALTRLGVARRYKIATRRHPIIGRFAFWLSLTTQSSLLAIAAVRRRSLEPIHALRALAGGVADILRNYWPSRTASQ